MKDKAKPRAPRKTTVPFEKHCSAPSAIVEGKFLALPDAKVYIWRVRSGCKPTWHLGTVIRVSETYVELWDETLSQWYCFDPSAKTVPDVRLSA